MTGIGAGTASLLPRGAEAKFFLLAPSPSVWEEWPCSGALFFAALGAGACDCAHVPHEAISQTIIHPAFTIGPVDETIMGTGRVCHGLDAA
jgi:hypothetical protein